MSGDDGQPRAASNDSPWSRMSEAERAAWIRAQSERLGAVLDDIDETGPDEPSLRSQVAQWAREHQAEHGPHRRPTGGTR